MRRGDRPLQSRLHGTGLHGAGIHRRRIHRADGQPMAASLRHQAGQRRRRVIWSSPWRHAPRRSRPRRRALCRHAPRCVIVRFSCRQRLAVLWRAGDVSPGPGSLRGRVPRITSELVGHLVGHLVGQHDSSCSVLFSRSWPPDLWRPRHAPGCRAGAAALSRCDGATSHATWTASMVTAGESFEISVRDLVLAT